MTEPIMKVRNPGVFCFIESIGISLTRSRLSAIERTGMNHPVESRLWMNPSEPVAYTHIGITNRAHEGVGIPRKLFV